MTHLLLDTSKEFRGGQRQLCYLAEGMVRKGVEFYVGLRPGSPLETQIKSIGARTIRIDPLFEGSPASALKLASHIREKKIALVNAQSSHDHTLAWEACALVHPRPVRVVTRRVDFAPGRGWFDRRKYLDGADRYIAISTAVRDVLTDWGIEKDKVRLIHSSVPGVKRVENARGELTGELGLSPDAYLIGNVASLVDHKGHEFLLRAVPAVVAAKPDTHFVLVGDGLLRVRLETLAGELRIRDHVHFLGRRSDIPRVLSALDLFVMASHMEGLCTSILDAMSLRVPVVATEAGGIPEIVRHGVTGLLTKNRDPASIAQAILAARENPAAASRRAENAWNMVREEFNLDKMVQSTLNLYEELLADRK